MPHPNNQETGSGILQVLRFAPDARKTVAEPNQLPSGAREPEIISSSSRSIVPPPSVSVSLAPPFSVAASLAWSLSFVASLASSLGVAVPLASSLATTFSSRTDTPLGRQHFTIHNVISRCGQRYTPAQQAQNGQIHRCRRSRVRPARSTKEANGRTGNEATTGRSG